MDRHGLTRRGFLATSGVGVAAAAAMDGATALAQASEDKPGAQRLSLARLRRWESLNYGMFIHYGMSTYVHNELPSGQDPPATYAPDRLDVDQWVSVARDAGMKYCILTTKHVAGHCLWPSQYTEYTVANSTDKTDVVGKFVEACQSKGILPGFYYCSWDNHNRFGSVTPSDPASEFGPYTTSKYQTFQTNQVTELLTQYGAIAEVWIDIPGVLGRGYRTFLYERIARLQPDAVIMMNSGISTQASYDVEYAWPSDIIAIERQLPPENGHSKWRTIESQDYYIPGEVCDPIGKEWFFVEGDQPRDDDVLLSQFEACRARGVNLLLDVPPDKHGVIPEPHVAALQRLRKNAGL